jgi:chemotaxis protein MotB
VTTKPQIIVIKRTGGHGGHHGGAWKVAYADFVTAMMALFIVLWLMNSSKQIQEAVGGYFKDPSGTSKMVGSDRTGTGDNLPLRKQDMAKLKEQLQTAIRQISDFDKLKAHIEMTVTAEGLRIELLESDTGLFFESGSSNPTNSAREVLTVLAPELGKLPNRVSIEGHTDAQPFSVSANYGNWELSADRANACRRLMQQNGLRSDQVAEVRGFADQNLRNKSEPTDAANRRITLLVKYTQKPTSDQAAPAEGTAEVDPGKAEKPEPQTANH